MVKMSCSECSIEGVAGLSIGFRAEVDQDAVHEAGGFSGAKDDDGVGASLVITRMVTEADVPDEEFYDWARGEMELQDSGAFSVCPPAGEVITVFKQRRFAWPRVYEFNDSYVEKATPSDDGERMEAIFKYSSMKEWPWYRAAWWWVKSWFGR